MEVLLSLNSSSSLSNISKTHKHHHKLKEEYDSKLLGLGDMRRSKWMEQVVELDRRSSHTHREVHHHHGDVE